VLAQRAESAEHRAAELFQFLESGTLWAPGVDHRLPMPLIARQKSKLRRICATKPRGFGLQCRIAEVKIGGLERQFDVRWVGLEPSAVRSYVQATERL